MYTWKTNIVHQCRIKSSTVTMYIIVSLLAHYGSRVPSFCARELSTHVYFKSCYSTASSPFSEVSVCTRKGLSKSRFLRTGEDIRASFGARNAFSAGFCWAFLSWSDRTGMKPFIVNLYNYIFILLYS